METKKVFITGMAGYIGGCLCRELDRRDWCGGFFGMDVKAPLAKYDKAEFRLMDINDPALVEWVVEIKPDIMVHLAYIVDTVADDELMHRVNVDGSANALKAAAEAEVPQVMVFSSGTAYGAWPDNPDRLKETDPLRANPEFKYAAGKAEVEAMCKEFMEKHPETIMSIIRPCVIYGLLVNNYLSGLLTMPVAVGIREYDPRVQFVHEDDVVGAILMILEKEARGPFNLAPPDALTIREAVEISKKPSLFLPEALMEPLLKLIWKLKLEFNHLPPSFLEYLRYPWLLDSSRLRDELGYEFRYSSRETVEIMLRAKGVIE